MSIERERSKALVTDRDVKQKTLAAFIGISEGKMSHYLTGKYDMPAFVVAGIARYFHVSTDYLLGLTDDPEPPLSLTASERGLLERYRALSRDQKELLLNTAALMQKQNQR